MALKVYSSRWCGDCRVAKRFLDKHGIQYEEVDIEQHPEAAEELERQTGRRAIPHFQLDGKWIQPYRPRHGFLFSEMKELLGIEDKLEVKVEEL